MRKKHNIKNVPSDLKLMTVIYEQYYEQYKNFDKNSPDRSRKIFVPLDIEAIAKHFKTDTNIIFGRLNLHLERKYGYKNENGSITPFFSRVLNEDKNVINFPLLTSAIAGLREERNRQTWTIVLSIIAITIAGLTFLLNGFKIWNEINFASHTQKQEIVNNQPQLKTETLKK